MQLLCQHAPDSKEGNVYCSEVIFPLFMCADISLCFLSEMRRITSAYCSFSQLMQLTSRFHFLVALGLSGSKTKATPRVGLGIPGKERLKEAKPMFCPM